MNIVMLQFRNLKVALNSAHKEQEASNFNNH